MIELKPCPFCGGEAMLDYECYGGGKSFVYCKSCRISTERFEISREYASDEKAIEAWNRRVSDEPD